MSPTLLFWFRIRKWAQWFVHDYIPLFSFVHLLLFYLSHPGGGAGDMQSPCFDFGFENGLNRLYFICTRMYTPLFVCTPLTFFSTSSWRGWGHAIPHFSDFGFENGLNRLYFVSTRLYTPFFVCTPLLFYLSLGGGGWQHAIPFFWSWIRKWA